jgi:hypothetical protein
VYVSTSSDNQSPSAGGAESSRGSPRPAAPRPANAGTAPRWWPRGPGAGSIPAARRISQTVDEAIFTPRVSSSPCARRYPHDGFSAARRSISTRIERTVRGRPRRRDRDAAAWRRACRSRCQRSTVSGRTNSRRRCRLGLGSVLSSAASHARSAGSNRTRCSPSRRCSTASWSAGRGFRVLVAVAARQQPQQRERVGDAQVCQSQQHETASSRSHRRRGPSGRRDRTKPRSSSPAGTPSEQHGRIFGRYNASRSSMRRHHRAVINDDGHAGRKGQRTKIVAAARERLRPARTQYSAGTGLINEYSQAA